MGQKSGPKHIYLRMYELFFFFVARVLNLNQYAQQQPGLKQETGGCNSNTLIFVSNLGCGVRASMFTEVLGRGIYRSVKS